MLRIKSVSFGLYKEIVIVKLVFSFLIFCFFQSYSSAEVIILNGTSSIF